MQQLTFFDIERDKALNVAVAAARRFAKTHYASIWTPRDMENEAIAYALEYLQDKDFNLRYLSQKVKFHLSHRLEQIDSNIRRARENRAQLVNVDAPEVAENNAFAPEELPLAVAVEIGEILAGFSPPVAAALTDVLNGWQYKEAAARNNISYKTLWVYMKDFREKIKNVL